MHGVGRQQMTTHHRAAIAKRIVNALQNGQLHKQGICDALNCIDATIAATMAEMRRRGDVIVLGTAKQAGYTDVNMHSPIYGLPGMTLQKIPSTKKPKTHSGSGQFALPNRGFNFKPLHRDPFEHMRLALITRSTTEGTPGT